MEEKKVLNNEELEKVNGGLGNTLISGTSIPGIDMNVIPDSEIDANAPDESKSKIVGCSELHGWDDSI
ncbi:MAG: class IIb bacteriocin, lactobin A/cerein 7B family [Bacteroidales bacterium]|nr:class IIb bacteriocin, lactobin A/cerein 7B family [Bacteroidales bacterium]